MRIRTLLTSITTTALLPFLISACSSAGEPDKWQLANNEEVIIDTYIDSSTGERYLNVIYRNFSKDSIRKLKYELITFENGKFDTSEREIILERRLLPQDARLVARRQTEKPVTYDRVESGKVWIVK
jgi:hypothetical protein